MRRHARRRRGNDPRFIEFRESLPMTATGKTLKRDLAAEQARGQADGRGRFGLVVDGGASGSEEA